MPNKNYQRGANFERTVKKEYEANGYFCVRSAGSHSAADLVCIKITQPTLENYNLQPVPPCVFLVQCGEKCEEKESKLRRLASVTGCLYDYRVIPPKRKSNPAHALAVANHKAFKRKKVGLKTLSEKELSTNTIS